MNIIERGHAPEVVREVTEADVLDRAADLLEEFGWCQCAPARTATGFSTTPEKGEARSFCLTGAIERAILDLTGENVRDSDEKPQMWLAVGTSLVRAGLPKDQPAWNNARGRERKEVVSALRAAAEKARA